MFLRRIAFAIPRSVRSFSRYSSHDLEKTFMKLHEDMKSSFGEPPASSFAGSTRMTQENESLPKLTHIGRKGEAQMVDVSPKEMSNRVAVASCKVILDRKVFDLVSANQMGKGDVLGVARIAGICAAKQTSNLIPLCHNINLSHVRVDMTLNPTNFCIEIEGEAVSTGKTGVEMEALTAVSVAGLTVYDMCKAASKNIVVTDVRLESKTGGKSGDWSRQKEVL